MSTEKPLSPLCGICGIDDPISDEMEPEEEGIISGGTEADKMGKESDDRDVRQLIDPRKPTPKGGGRARFISSALSQLVCYMY